MSTAVTTASATESSDEAASPTDAERRSVFWEWCLRREAFRIWPQLLVVAPLVLLEVLSWLSEWPGRWYSSQGYDLLRFFFGVASFQILAGGCFHASRAVCWEVSPELRGLVRLTGIGPISLLACKTLARWWTIGSSVFLLVPLACFAMTLGGVTRDQFWCFGWVLLMLTALTAGLATVAGVSATDAENATTTASFGTFILIVLYHMVFWLPAGLLRLAYRMIEGFGLPIPINSWWGVPFDLAWRTSPVGIIVRAEMSPDLFSPLAPSFWIHFLTAAFCFRMSLIVMIRRFRSLRVPSEVLFESPGGASDGSVTGRPRCTDAPFFWKDAYVLARGSPLQTFWTENYALMTFVILLLNGVSLAGLAGSKANLPVTCGVIAECMLPVLFTVRLDALLSAEFRQQTWQSLMLLPIDRRTILWAKLQAVAWEQRFVVVPAGIAIAFALPYSPMGVAMTGVIAALGGLVLCQFSTLHYLSRHGSWTGALRMGAILILILFSLLVWLSIGPWGGFFTTVALLVLLLIVFQSFIDYQIETWTET